MEQQENSTVPPWSDIENSNKYQDLDYDSRMKVRGGYFDDVASKNEKYIQADDVKKKEVRDGWMAKESEVLPIQEERGIVGDTVSHLARGAANLSKMAGGAMRVADLNPDDNDGFMDRAGQKLIDLGENAPQHAKIFRPDQSEAKGEEGFVKRTYGMALESAPASLTPMATTAAGAVAGTAIMPGVGTVVGGGLGLITGLIGTFGLGTYNEARTNAIKHLKKTRPELSESEIKQQAHDNGMTHALYEVGTEALGDLAAMATFGMGKVFIHTAKNGAKATLKSVLSNSPKEFAKKFAKAYVTDMPFEAGSEILAYYGQSKADEKIGMGEGATGKGMLEAAGTAAWMSGILGGGISGYNAVQSKKLTNDLNSEDVATREKAADIISGKIRKNLDDEGIAAQWRIEAQNAIVSGEKIGTDEKIVEFGKVKVAEDNGEAPAIEEPPLPTDVQTPPEIEQKPKGVLAKAVDKAPIQPISTTGDTLLTNLAADQNGSLPENNELKPVSKAKEAALKEPFDNTTIEGQDETTTQTDQERENQGIQKNKGEGEAQAEVETHILADGKVINKLTGELISSPEIIAPKELSGQAAVDYVTAKNEGLDDKGALTYAKRDVIAAQKGIDAKKEKTEVLKPESDKIDGEEALTPENSEAKNEEDVQQNVDGISSEHADGKQNSETTERPTGETKRVEVVKNSKSIAHGQEVNTAPSEKQKEAENYKKGHVRLDGMDITIENPAGSTRSGTDQSGREWSQNMKHDYGYVKGSVGHDKDHVDVFFANGYTGGAEKVHIVNQHTQDGSFDEHKVVIGARTKGAARQTYLANYEKGWNGGKSVVEMPMDEFKQWVKSDAPKKGAVNSGKEVTAKKEAPIEQSARKFPKGNISTIAGAVENKTRSQYRLGEGEWIITGSNRTLYTDSREPADRIPAEIIKYNDNEYEATVHTFKDDYVQTPDLKNSNTKDFKTAAEAVEFIREQMDKKYSPAVTKPKQKLTPKQKEAMEWFNAGQSVDEEGMNKGVDGYKGRIRPAVLKKLEEKGLIEFLGGFDEWYSVELIERDNMRETEANLLEQQQKKSEEKRKKGEQDGIRSDVEKPGDRDNGKGTGRVRQVDGKDTGRSGSDGQASERNSESPSKTKSGAREEGKEKTGIRGKRGVSDAEEKQDVGGNQLGRGEEEVSSGTWEDYTGRHEEEDGTFQMSKSILKFVNSEIQKNDGNVEVFSIPHSPDSGIAGITIKQNDGSYTGANPFTEEFFDKDEEFNAPDKVAKDIEKRGKIVLYKDGKNVTTIVYIKGEKKKKSTTAEIKSKPKEGGKVENVGEKLHGSRADKAALRTLLDEVLSDDDLRSKPLSKLWPKPKLKTLDNSFASAFMVAARAEIPNKPRMKYKLARWVEMVKALHTFSKEVVSGDLDAKRAERKLQETAGLAGFAKKVEMYQAIDKDLWYKIKDIGNAPNSSRYIRSKKEGADPERVHAPFASVNGKSYPYKESYNEVLSEIESDLQGATGKAKMRFEVRGSARNGYFVNKKGDSEYRHLKEFDNSKDAIEYRNTHQSELEKAWEEIKERDNVRKTDTRKKDNQPRTGKDYRKDKDVDAQSFMDTFGFRGVEFGKWVSQGKGKRDRQGMLNAAYDALLDLSGMLGIPPKAISLNGTLGLGFGSRGSGWASAHFEPNTLVINLTKPRGAGALAHEWFHALDNYFSRRRGGEKAFTGSNLEYRNQNYITYKPEAMYVHPSLGAGSWKYTKRQRDRWEKNNPDKFTEGWTRDPDHPQGVRPEVEERFAELVRLLDESDMFKRSKLIDKGKAEGYWSRILERAARAFENYAITKMQDDGYQNDYLANVVAVSSFSRAVARYPYLTEKEIAPIKEAFDNLFAEIKTEETDKGVALYSKSEAPLPVGKQANVADELSERGNLGKRRLRGLVKKGLLEIVSPERAERILSTGVEVKFSTTKDGGITSPRTPDVLLALGASDNGLFMPHSIVSKITDGKHKGALTADELQAVGHGIYDPLAVFKSKTDSRSVVVITEVMNREGNRVVVPVLIGRGAKSASVVKSIYGKKSKKWFADQVEEGNVLYLNTKMANQGIAMSRTAPFAHPQLKDVAHGDYSWLESALALQNSILTEKDIVKPEVKKSDDGRIEGFQIGNKAYLVDGNIKEGEAFAVLLHEVGSHLFLENSFQGEQWDRIVRRFDRFAKKDNETGRAIRAARKRIPKSTKPEHRASEGIAYYLSAKANSEQSLYRRIVAYIKEKLVNLGFPASIFTPDDVVVIAKAALRRSYSPVQSADSGGVRYSVADAGATKPILPSETIQKERKERNAKAKKEAAGDKAFMQALAEVAPGAVRYIKPEKPDMNFLEILFSTPEYAFRKFAASWQVLQAQLDRRDLKTELENDILGENYKDKDGNLVEQGEFLDRTNKLKKKNIESYNKVSGYLVETDQTGKGYRIKNELEEWIVKDSKGKVVERFKVSEHPDGQAEALAVEAMRQYEAEELRGQGFNKEEVKLVLLARKLTNRAFELLIADLRRIEQEAKEAGLPTPALGEIDEAGRYGVYNGKKLIAAYESQEEAADSLSNAARVISYAIHSKKGGAIVRGDFTQRDKAEAWAAKNDIDIRDKGVFIIKTKNKFTKLEIRKRTDEELRPLSIQEAIAQMNDLRGVFFPRLREPGAYVMIARKDGANPIREHFDIPGFDDKNSGNVLGFLKKGANLLTPAGKRVRELRKQGYNVSMKKDDSISEDVFDATRLTSSLDAILQQAMSVADKNNSDQLEMGKQINKILTLQIADIFKARGYLSTRMKRTEEVWEGYEQDMQKALVQYGRNLAAGIAKRDTAQKMILAFTGKDYSWTDYKNDVGDQADWDEYNKIVEKRRVDPGKQKVLYGQVRNFVIDALRNEEYADRMMGTLKGLAAIKFLGFRISSAAINMTNMVQAVPATISAHTDDSILKSLNRVKHAVTVYTQYKTNSEKISPEDRDIYQEITSRGWDQAMYNMELASVLRSKLAGRWAKFTDASMFLFGAAEKVNRATTIFAAYKAVTKKHPNMSFDDAMAEAKHISDRAHGVYGKETMPAWTKGAYNPLKLAYTFQKFSHNYMLNMLEMGFSKKEWKAASYMLLSPAILGGAGATLATPLISAMASALGIGGDDPEEAFYKLVEETFGSDQMVRHGLPGWAGVTFKGSLEMHNPMPRKLSEIGGAPMGVLTDLWKGAKHFWDREFYKGFESMAPTAFGNMSKALRESREGVTTGSYSSVYYGNEPLKADSWDAVVRFLSFNPARLAGIREKQWSEKQVAKAYQERRKKINSRIKKEWLQAGGDISDKIWGEIWKEVYRYNELVRGSGRSDIRPITSRSIRNLIRRNRRAPKRERLRNAT